MSNRLPEIFYLLQRVPETLGGFIHCRMTVSLPAASALLGPLLYLPRVSAKLVCIIDPVNTFLALSILYNRKNNYNNKNQQKFC